MKKIFKLIFTNLKSFFSDKENTKMVAKWFIDFYYKVAKEAKEANENKSKQS